MLLSNSEIEKLEKKIDSLCDQGDFTAAKVLYKDASKRGSGRASSILASGYDKNSKLHPDVFDSLFIKERRRSKRYYNRALKLFRRQAKLGSYRAMFSLYGNLYLGYPRRLKLKTRLKLAE